MTSPTVTMTLAVGLPFAWWGAVVAISFVETPLKFRAPGMTTPLALGIGRLVFPALNALEGALAVGVVIGMSTAGSIDAPAWLLLAFVIAALLVQVLVLRPALDRRVDAAQAGDDPPPSRLHLGYVAADVLKVVALPTLAVLVAGGITT